MLCYLSSNPAFPPPIAEVIVFGMGGILRITSRPLREARAWARARGPARACEGVRACRRA